MVDFFSVLENITTLLDCNNIIIIRRSERFMQQLLFRSFFFVFVAISVANSVFLIKIIIEAIKFSWFNYR